MNKAIMIRTVKIALAALLAIFLAQGLGLEFSSAAGIIAILNIFETRKATMQGGLKRTVSAVIALFVGGVLFELIGYDTWVFGLYLLIFVPVSFLLKVEIGLGPSSVLVTHLLAFGEINLGIILNEMGLVIIGTSFAMLTNYYAPNSQSELIRLIEGIDREIESLLKLYGQSLVDPLDVQAYEDLIDTLEKDLSDAIILAVIEQDNLIEYSSDLLYVLRLREMELDLLQDMYNNLKTIPPEYSDGQLVSDILIQTANSLNKEADIQKMKDRVAYLKDHFHMMQLPQTHEEFAIRAAIFQVFRDLDQFIEISHRINLKAKSKGMLAGLLLKAK